MLVNCGILPCGKGAIAVGGASLLVCGADTMEIGWIGNRYNGRADGATIDRRSQIASASSIAQPTRRERSPLTERSSRRMRPRASRARKVAFITVPDTPDVEATVAKIEPALVAGQLVVDMSTISPAAERAIASPA